jgi:circadian clock protein KaiB
MAAKKSTTPRLLSKLATGIQGFDEISCGGLPRNRTSLVMGDPGTGKSIFALQGPARTATGSRNVARKRAKADATEVPVTTVVVMCLYVAGRAPNSIKAIANLEAICRRHLKDGYKLEIVDVCEHPRRALADGVIVTPSLTKVSPGPASNVIGNLSDTSSVLAALGLSVGIAE